MSRARYAKSADRIEGEILIMRIGPFNQQGDGAAADGIGWLKRPGTGSSPASPAQPSRPAGDAGRRFSDRGPAVRRPSIGQKNTHTLYQSPRQIATRKRGDSPVPEACGGKNHVHSVNFAKKGFTFAADSCRISASFSGRTSFFCRTRRSYEFLPKNWQLPGPVHVWAQRRGPAGVRDPLGGHYSGRGQPLCPEPGGLQHSVGGGHGADHLDGVSHVFQEPVQAPGRKRGLYEQGGLSPAAGPVPQPGQGAQVFHLPQLPHGVPGTPGQGPHRHHLPQVRRGNPRQKLTARKYQLPARVPRAGSFFALPLIRSTPPGRPPAASHRRLLCSRHRRRARPHSRR